MLQGAVKMFNPDRGFGFISRDDNGPDVFVHIRTLQRSGIETLEIGQRLTFEVETQPDGRLRAVGVRVGS